MSAPSFDEFFYALHEREPFPWQRMLADRVQTSGWPEVLALPTAAGKTSVIDIAVFALATATRERPQPRRIFFVVDRRVVVDEAFEQARALAERLGEGSGVLGEIATMLRALGGEAPLRAAVLRGGIYRDHGWARSPAQPLVCVSTVDQVGSRLLFRGYGVGNQQPIHAGLAGNDSLIVLDEVHLSRPFEQTLHWLGRYRNWAEQPVTTPWHVVRMSATPDPEAPDVFPSASQRDEALDHPDLERRLSASKRARLESGTDDVSFGKQLADHARGLRDQRPDARVTGVIANRVATAREAFDDLEGEGDRLLLIGRNRPWDRDDLIASYFGRIKAGRTRTADADPLFVVATQCIEVGANIDFDALVTEVAPIDSLRQRFGRLDRLGDLETSSAVIVARKESVAKNAIDPIYGRSLSATWRWMKDRLPAGRGVERTIDFGVLAIESALPNAEELAELTAPRANAPVLLPAHLDRWTQTSPQPVPDPDVSLFLHGPEAGPPDVQIVWRGDLPERDSSSWASIVALLPPVSSEMMQVPFRIAKSWFSGAAFSDMADVEGAPEGDDSADTDKGPNVLRWRGSDSPETRVIDPNQLRPGDTIVVRSERGGADQFGWNPTSGYVDDVAEGAISRQRSRAVLRLHPAILDRLDENRSQLRAGLGALLEAIEAGDNWRATLDEMLEQLSSAEDAPDHIRRAASELMGDAKRRMTSYPDGSGVAVVGCRRLGSAGQGVRDEITDEDLTSSLTSTISLAAHTEGVRDQVRRFADACGLGEELTRDLELAARLHDLGKVDPRFQVMLHGGDEVATQLASEPLAKSGMDSRDRAALRRARERSGYPPGSRHEAASVALVAAAGCVLKSAQDPDLVLHLVASHHGCARPFLPAVEDPAPVPLSATLDGMRMEASSAHGLERLDSGVPDRFWRCVRRYGWYGLAYLEAILRLADHRTSEEEAG